MQLLKSIIFLCATTLLFVGNVGLDVFKHICEEDGVSVSYVINTITHCEEVDEEIPECCQEEHEDDCCDDEVAYYQVKLDFFEQPQLPTFSIVNWAPFTFNEIQLSARISESRYFTNCDPPPKELSRRLSIIQAYLI